jgi:hypothetical protein
MRRVKREHDLARTVRGCDELHTEMIDERAFDRARGTRSVGCAALPACFLMRHDDAQSV